jgi:dTDP-4-amino-4,6-dideoxygalactose transaminase
MMDLQAALGIHQLRRVEENWLRRQEIWNQYQQSFASLPVIRPSDPEPDTRHGYHLYTLEIDDNNCGISRDALMQKLGQAGIGTGVHYRSLAQHSFYQERFGWHPNQYPVSTKFGNQTISLPLGPKLQDDDVARVIKSVSAELLR